MKRRRSPGERLVRLALLALLCLPCGGCKFLQDEFTFLDRAAPPAAPAPAATDPER